jgi:hypothetical protein
MQPLLRGWVLPMQRYCTTGRRVAQPLWGTLYKGVDRRCQATAAAVQLRPCSLVSATVATTAVATTTLLVASAAVSATCNTPNQWS